MKPVIAGLLRQVGLCLALCHMPAALAQSPAENERLLKTAFVFNFAKLTRWPANTWTEDAPMFNLCTAGSDDLVTSLRHLGRERIAGHPVAIRALQAADSPNACHALYIAGSEHMSFLRWIDGTRSRPVLTISEIRGFADAGGAIQLYQDKDRIRFRINVDAARDRGLTLSARLLDLAVIVDREAGR
ncbi:MAG TPA: YfiR family protein [Gammaproteobacteria bacterium]|nr:YfiR family protein [Gammaproteobacteria bacterium]